MLNINIKCELKYVKAYISIEYVNTVTCESYSLLG